MRSFLSNTEILAVVAFLVCFQGSSAPAAEEQVAATSSASSGGETTASTSTSNQGSSIAATTSTSSQGSSTAASISTSSGGAATNPSGTGIFSPLPVRLSISISEGYDDNVNTAPSNGQSSSYTSGNVLLNYAFGSPQLRFSLDTSAGVTYYWQHISNQDYDINLQGHFVLQYKATPRLTLGSDVLIAYLTEPSFNYGVGLNTRAGNYLYTLDTFSASYLWAPRFSTVTHYTLTVVNYDDDSVGMLQDRVENTFGNEFRFLLTPVTALIGEYRLELVHYTQAQNPLDSTTHFVLGGFDHTFNPRLNVTVHAGAQFRSYSDGGTRNSPYVEGNLNYTVGRRTTLSWINHYGLEEPDVVNSQNPTVFRTGLEGKFNLTPRISTTLGVYYVHSDYPESTTPLSLGGIIIGETTVPAFTQDEFDGAIELRFAISPLIGAQLGYHYTDVTSDSVVGQTYHRNRVFGGFNVTF